MSTLAVTRFPARTHIVADQLTGTSRKIPALMARIAVWIRAANSRRRLAELDDRMLADLGVSREQAAQESARPFWDVTLNARC